MGNFSRVEKLALAILALNLVELVITIAEKLC